MRRNPLSFAVLAASLIAGCAVPGHHPSDRLSPDGEGSAIAEVVLVPVTPALVSRLNAEAQVAPRANPALEQELREYEYRIGPQDVLTFTVWDHPELTIPAGEFRSPEASGHKVDRDGKIFFPYVGEVAVGGRTLREVRTELTERLAKFVTRPQLDVRIAAYRSQQVLVTGEVRNPGVLPVTEVPVTLAMAINQLGGPTPAADLRSVVVVRGGQPRRVDLNALLDHGDATQDLVLRAGDTVNVPDSAFNRVHVLGEVKQPGTVPMLRGTTTLADALGTVGGLNEATADAGRIFVFRGAPEKPDVYWLDAESPETMLLAAQLPLRPLDVVYVAPASGVGYNRVISQVLPTIQALYQLAIIRRDLLDN